MELKNCSICKTDKPIDEFLQNRKSGARSAYCHPCRRQYQRELYRKHLEHRRALCRHYSKVHAVKIKIRTKEYRNRPTVKARQREYHAAYRQQHQETLRASKAAYYEANTDLYRARSRAYIPSEEGRARRRTYWRRYSQEKKVSRREGQRRRRQVNPQKATDACIRYRARRKGAPVVEVVDRLAIIERDNRTCYLCNAVLAVDQITLDHVIPLSRGGSHTAANLKVACGSCNSRKHARTVEEYLAIKATGLYSQDGY